MKHTTVYAQFQIYYRTFSVTIGHIALLFRTFDVLPACLQINDLKIMAAGYQKKTNANAVIYSSNSEYRSSNLI